MKLIRADGKKVEFEISHKEKELLLFVLGLYPLVPETHHRLSKSGQIPNQDENQQLLDESLKAHRKANKRQVLAMLNQPERFTECAKGVRVGFTRGEIEWLLQVLNDVRIGSWLALGSPGYAELKGYVPNKKSVRHLVAMQVAGGFETEFLAAVSG